MSRVFIYSLFTPHFHQHTPSSTCETLIEPWPTIFPPPVRQPLALAAPATPANALRRDPLSTARVSFLYSLGFFEIIAGGRVQDVVRFEVI